jgi:hypothetical protein
MRKEVFLNKVEEIISNITDEKYLTKDWESNSIEIDFKDSNGKSCEIKMYSYFFGFVREVSFWIDFTHIIDYKLSKKEHRKILTKFDNRIKEIKNSKLNNFFKDEVRDNKIEQLIN